MHNRRGKARPHPNRDGRARINQYPVRESNPCYRRERATSWATRRTGREEMTNVQFPNDHWNRTFSATIRRLSIPDNYLPLATNDQQLRSNSLGERHKRCFQVDLFLGQFRERVAVIEQ
jgi:hypothetical protein